MEKTELVEFKINDNLIAIEMKFKLDEERLYVHDETKGWVMLNVSAMIARDLMTVKDEAAVLN